MNLCTSSEMLAILSSANNTCLDIVHKCCRWVSPGTPILRVALRRSPEDTYPTTLTNIPAAIQERFQCARPYALTPKIAPARQMRRLTEVWRSRDALWEVTGSHVFNKITTETLTARNNFQSVFSTKVYIFLK